MEQMYLHAEMAYYRFHETSTTEVSHKQVEPKLTLM